mmetsp:Transcript_92179/g.166463  ORF Transcript_92179/g.166463 Transcript_92179/m.166463 type:complete len:706 (-) Transcript_92179:575-2692(-)
MPKRFSQNGVHVSKGPTFRGRCKVTECLIALVEKQVLEGGEQVGGALRELGYVPTSTCQLQPHGTHLIAILRLPIDSVAQNAGCSIRECLEDIRRVLELFADGLPSIKLHDARLARPTVGLEGLDTNNHGAAESATELVGFESLKHLQQQPLVDICPGVICEEFRTGGGNVLYLCPGALVGLRAVVLEGRNLVPAPKARDGLPMDVFGGGREVLALGQADFGQSILIDLRLLERDHKDSLAVLDDARQRVGLCRQRLLVWSIGHVHRQRFSCDALFDVHLQAGLEPAVEHRLHRGVLEGHIHPGKIISGLDPRGSRLLVGHHEEHIVEADLQVEHVHDTDELALVVHLQPAKALLNLMVETCDAPVATCIKELQVHFLCQKTPKLIFVPQLNPALLLHPPILLYQSAELLVHVCQLLLHVDPLLLVVSKLLLQSHHRRTHVQPLSLRVEQFSKEVGLIHHSLNRIDLDEVLVDRLCIWDWLPILIATVHNPGIERVDVVVEEDLLTLSPPAKQDHELPGVCLLAMKLPPGPVVLDRRSGLPIQVAGEPLAEMPHPLHRRTVEGALHKLSPLPRVGRGLRFRPRPCIPGVAGPIGEGVQQQHRALLVSIERVQRVDAAVRDTGHGTVQRTYVLYEAREDRMPQLAKRIPLCLDLLVICTKGPEKQSKRSSLPLQGCYEVKERWKHVEGGTFKACHLSLFGVPDLWC